MAYLTQTILEETLTAAKVSALVASAGEVTRTIGYAEAETEGALLNGGYAAAVPASTYASDASNCPKLIQLAAIGAWIRIAYGRHDIEVPAGFREYIDKLEQIRTGALEIHGVAKVVARSVGGMDFTQSSTAVSVDDGSRPQVFSRKTMQGF